ncbi:hypothetical protein BCV69DRAFT_296122 [Microstroma glucosiphilum]|uniref:ATP synthase F(0) complex subunit e, mitochondrial n=1 Tax=Pseudomicrostroma glucosiphilum TaxID=1684307 RepID=A0A316UEZ1_9BASI|nr:hypothetical protein BCV69DRAFT_296122 [Pseudomicrostroma glucosiphilum]PWN23809.1 hypothetical protein BCV69DRAFT_296122 [Pseudomicrostroma glucosiphilum]
MSPSPVVNVVRYSALVGGIGYGILHRRTLQGVEDKNFAQAEWKRKENLIKEAKEAYKNRLVQNVAAMQSDVVSDPDSPNFDLEKLINSLDH